MEKRDYPKFDCLLVQGETRAALALSGELLDRHGDDPVCWLKRAQACFLSDDYPGAASAAERAGRMLEDLVRGCSGPARAVAESATRALAWRAEKVRTDLLTVAVRGDPEARAGLIRGLERLHELGAEDLSLDVVARHELASARMGSGQYDRAAELFDDPDYGFRALTYEKVHHRQLLFPVLFRWLAEFRREPLARIAPFRGAGDRYVLVLAVWGEPFLDSLERFTLPSRLAPGNLPALAAAGEARLVCFTTKSGRSRLERMPVFAAVRAAIACEIVTFPDAVPAFPDTYKIMSAMHVAAMELARAAGAHFLFLAPDIVVADNFLATLDRSRKEGAEVVFVPGLMLLMDSFGEELVRNCPAVDQVLAVSPDRLLRLALGHVHPYSLKAYAFAPVMRRPSASILLWPLANGGFIQHGFHHTPYLVSARAMARFDGSMFFTIDGEFLLKILRGPADLERCALVAPGRETSYFELSRGGRDDPGTDFDLDRLVRWGRLQGFVARWLFGQKVWFDPDGTGREDPAAGASTGVVGQVLEGMAAAPGG